mgnify:CR=1 FL=1
MPTTRAAVLQAFASIRCSAILRTDDRDVVRPALEAAIAAGFRIVEVTMTTPDCLEHIAALCREHDLIAVTDEVYEHLVYEGTHVPLAALPGMRERTVLISSSGKTFSFTGWKVGHTCAPPALTAALRTAHQFVTFCTATPFQHALARAFVAEDSFFTGLTAEYRARRDRLCDGLQKIGLDVLTPAGTYFVMTDIRSLGYTDDIEFCRMLPEQIGVAAIPTSVFYVNQHEGKHLVCWAYCKTDDVLDEGLRRLQKLRR